jgi:S1-C subfamily serine protease
VAVTAEEALARDENLKLTLPGGRVVDATLAGRDPTTDVAVLRFQPEGLASAVITDAPPNAGELVLAVGGYEGGPLAHLGIVVFSNGPWHSRRGGTIDRFLRLDLSLSPAAEGGAVVDVQGRVIGMAVLGPRRRVLAIPSRTVDRAVDQLLARGHVYRGYLGAGLQSVRSSRAAEKASGVLVVSIDPDGPSARAGILVGDILTKWNGSPIARVREIMRLLGPESVDSTVELELMRGGAATSGKIVIGERPIT